MDSLTTQINDLKPQIFFLSQFEKGFLGLSHKDMNNYLTEENISNLFKDLDADSKANLTLIISRVKKYFANPTLQHDCFTLEEKEEIKRCNDEYRNIVMIANDVWGFKGYLLPINHFERCIFFRDYIPKVVREHYQKNTAIVDCGAFIGDTALRLDELNPSKIYCFEANINNARLLERTVKLNNLQNVEIINKGLGDSEGFAYLSNKGSCSSFFSQKDIKIDIVTLDGYFKDKREKIGLIKTDVEGYEPKLLEGAKEILKRDKPVLMISIYHNSHDLFMIKQYLEALDLGYKFVISRPAPLAILLETMLYAY